jgi:hypothetical protein
MIFIKNKTITLDAFTYVDDVYNYYKVDKAQKFLPSWWRDTDYSYQDEFVSYKKPTIKSCVGITDLYKRGFIMPIWSDLLCKVKDNNFSWAYADKRYSSASPHYYQEWKTYADNEKFFHLKIDSLWQFKTKQNIPFLCIPVSWDKKLEKTQIDYITSTGIASYNVQHSTNVNLMIPNENKEFIIKQGTPIYHFVPLTEKNVEIKHHLITVEAFQKMHLLQSSFLNNYLNAVKRNKCPFNF